MGSYQTTSRIKDRISYSADDFECFDSEAKFDALLTYTEEESRGLIESYMGDETFEKETRTDTLTAEDTRRLSLTYPVQTVSKVERRFSHETWTEMETDMYRHDEHYLHLRRIPVSRRLSARISRFSDVLYRETRRYIDAPRWTDVGESIRVTYDRGFDSIPKNVLNIQISLINRMLRGLKGEQALKMMNPADPEFNPPNLGVMTEDIRGRLDDITHFGKRSLVI